MTRTEAAKSLCISIRKLDNLIKSGDLPTIRFGRSIRINPEAINELVGKSQSKPAKRKP
jgi:hypothetical protein